MTFDLTICFAGERKSRKDSCLADHLSQIKRHWVSVRPSNGGKTYQITQLGVFGGVPSHHMLNKIVKAKTVSIVRDDTPPYLQRTWRSYHDLTGMARAVVGGNGRKTRLQCKFHVSRGLRMSRLCKYCSSALRLLGGLLEGAQWPKAAQTPK